VRDELSVLSAFLTVAEERSFTRAAKRLNISTSGLSSGLQTTPVGRVRLLCPRLAAKSVLAPKLGQFVRDYPDVILEVTTDDSRIDPVAAGFDAAIHYGEFIAQDMVAVRVSPDIQHAIIGAPSYFQSRTTPTLPRNLLSHRCINFRHRGESVYKWELEKAAESVAIAVDGPLVLDDEDLVMQAALDGAGLALVAQHRAAPHLARGELIRVMEDWTPPFPGFFLYYPHRKRQPGALTAVIEAFRLFASQDSR
jgi:DNA-binding transcriptional LysR family regulator